MQLHPLTVMIAEQSLDALHERLMRGMLATDYRPCADCRSRAKKRLDPTVICNCSDADILVGWWFEEYVLVGLDCSAWRLEQPWADSELFWVVGASAAHSQ